MPPPWGVVSRMPSRTGGNYHTPSRPGSTRADLSIRSSPTRRVTPAESRCSTEGPTAPPGPIVKKEDRRGMPYQGAQRLVNTIVTGGKLDGQLPAQVLCALPKVTLAASAL